MKKLLFLALLLLPVFSYAGDLIIPALTVSPGNDGSKDYSVTIQILLAMTALSLLPAAVMMMTSFTRIIIVLGILRQAIGMPQTPTNQILVGLALFLSLFVMAPVFNKVNDVALQPYMNDKLNAKQAMTAAEKPLRAFMLKQTRKNDLELFSSIAGYKKEVKVEDLPLTVLIPSFVTSELKTAFQIGFLLFLPFLIIDLVVASTLMSMGMMMLSPLIISLPFKLMLFVLVDGWTLVIGSLTSSFGV